LTNSPPAPRTPSSANAANLLTASRLVMAPLAVRAILLGEYRLALGIFVAAAITDGLDGLVARRSGRLTRLGAWLDPVADKVLLSSAYLALGIAGAVPWWLVGIIFGRDILILAGAGAALLLTRERNFPPSVWGKLSTFVQLFTAVFVMLARAWPAIGFERWAGALAWPTAAATLWSGFHYAWRGREALRNSRRHRPGNSRAR
jgi:cardiolipin synthase